MKKYHLNDGNEQTGPFSLEELKEQKINKDTLVWTESMTEWQKADTIEELKSLFVVTPPPINKVTPPPINKNIPPPIIKDIPNKEEKQPSVTTEKKKSKTGLIVAIIIGGILVFGGIIAFIKKTAQSQAVEQIQQHETNKQIEADMAEQQLQIEADMAAQQLQTEAELESLNYDYDQAVTNLRAAEIRLNEIQQFQLLRTASEKEQQVQGQLETIRSWENEVDRLKKEINKY